MLSGLMAGLPSYGEVLNDVLRQLEVFDKDDFSDEAQQKVFFEVRARRNPLCCPRCTK